MPVPVPGRGRAAAPWAGGGHRNCGGQAWETVVVSRPAGVLLKRDGDSVDSSEQLAQGDAGRANERPRLIRRAGDSPAAGWK